MKTPIVRQVGVLVVVLTPTLLLAVLLWVRSRTVVVDIGDTVERNPTGRLQIAALARTLQANPTAWNVRVVWKWGSGYDWTEYDRRHHILYQGKPGGGWLPCDYDEQTIHKAADPDTGARYIMGPYCD